MTEFWQAIKGQPLKIYSICLFGLVLSNLDQSFFGYAIPGIMAEFEVGIDIIGWVLSASFMFAAGMMVLVGLAADHYGRSRVFTVCLILPAFLVGLHAFAPDILSLTMLRALAFGFTVSMIPLATTYTAEVSPARYRGLLAGLLQVAYPIGWFLASLITVPILAAYTWREIFLPAFLIIPVAVVVSRFLSESNRFLVRRRDVESENKLHWLDHVKTLTEPVFRRRVALCSAMLFLHGGAYAGTAFYFPTFLSETRGYSEEVAVGITGLSYGIGAVGYIAAAIIGEFFLTRRNTIALWMAIGTLAFLGLIWLGGTSTTDIFWFAVMSVFFYGAVAVQLPLVAELFPTKARATSAAICGAAAQLGFAIYPVLVAQLVEPLGWNWAFTVVVVPSLALSVAATLGLQNLKSGMTLEETSKGT